MTNPTKSPARRRAGSLLLAILALAVLCLPGVGLAQVHDNAAMFSDPAKQKALDSIGQLKQKLGRTLLVETYDKVPPERAAELQAKGKAKFVADFARERGKAEQVDGVVLVLFKDVGDGKGRYDVVIGKETEKKLFTQADLKDMKGSFEAALKEKRYDEALTRTADYVYKRMVENNGAKSAAAAPANTGGTTSSGSGGGAVPRAAEPSCGVGGMSVTSLFCIGIAVVGAFLIFRGISRARQQGYGPGGGGYGGGGGGGPGYNQGGGYGGGPGYGGPGYGGPGYGAPGGGGGFGRGILGGVLGGVAGSYIGNKVFGQDHGPTPPAGGGVGSAPPVDPGPGHDTDYSDAGGGDFGGPDTSSGFDGGGSYDSGGGFDAGGGDFGGGDSGGGGGDF